MSDSLQPHESQHVRPPCPSPTPGVHSDSCPLSRWCHPAISSYVIPFSSCPQSLPASESFPMSQLFAWGGQSIGVSALASVLPKKSQGWSPSEWTGWISPYQSSITPKKLLIIARGRYQSQAPPEREVTCIPRWEVCNYFTTQAGGMKTSFLPINKSGQWEMLQLGQWEATVIWTFTFLQRTFNFFKLLPKN